MAHMTKLSCGPVILPAIAVPFVFHGTAKVFTGVRRGLGVDAKGRTRPYHAPT